MESYTERNCWLWESIRRRNKFFVVWKFLRNFYAIREEHNNLLNKIFFLDWTIRLLARLREISSVFCYFLLSKNPVKTHLPGVYWFQSVMICNLEARVTVWFLLLGLILISTILTREFPLNPSGKLVEDELQKYHAGACKWESKNISGALKKRWPDVIGLGFAKVSFIVILTSLCMGGRTSSPSSKWLLNNYLALIKSAETSDNPRFWKSVLKAVCFKNVTAWRSGVKRRGEGGENKSRATFNFFIAKTFHALIQIYRLSIAAGGL